MIVTAKTKNLGLIKVHVNNYIKTTGERQNSLNLLAESMSIQTAACIKESCCIRFHCLSAIIFAKVTYISKEYISIDLYECYHRDAIQPRTFELHNRADCFDLCIRNMSDIAYSLNAPESFAMSFSNVESDDFAILTYLNEAGIVICDYFQYLDRLIDLQCFFFQVLLKQAYPAFDLASERFWNLSDYC